LDATEDDIIRFAEDWAEAIFQAKIDSIIENIRA
jgi:hypothetical protein